MLASAGTGKTYQLTSRYLRLILDGAAPRTILATTFTRAAAAEIRDRVLVTAAQAVLSDDSRTELAKRVVRDDVSQVEVLGLLETLLDDIDGLQICTLHSFFSQVTSAFASELGLPDAMEMLTDDSERGFQNRALARAFESAMASGEKDAFLGALAGLAKGAPERSVTRTVRSVTESGLETYFEARCAPTPWIWKQQPPPPLSLKAISQELRAVAAQRSADSGKLDAIGKNLEKLATALDEYQQQGMRDTLDRWESLIKSGVAAKIRAGEDTFSKVLIDEPTHAVIAPLNDHLYRLALADYGARTASTYYLLHEYARAREEIRRQEGIATFGDIIRFLAMEPDALLREDIWYRLDGRIQHLLLDEFQDTSLMEWDVLRPLAAEIVADGSGDRTFFCVGDVKQSIYGWRGGLPEILEDLPDMIFEDGVQADLTEATLSESHRSAPEVLDAVNAVFGTIRQNRAIQESSAGAADAFARSWKNHETALKELRGCVELRCVEPEEKTSKARERASAREAARLAAELHRANPQLEIGVLAPKNAVVTQVVELLRADGIDATGEGGGSFLDCGASVVALDALRLAEHPGDSAAAFNVMHSPLGEILGLSTLKDASSTARAIRRSLTEDGLAQTIESWVRALSGRLDRRETARLERLISEAQRVEHSGETSPARAAETLERTHLDEPGSNVIRAMTVHGSKGLAFDVVIAPGLDGALFHTPPALALDRKMPPGDIRRIIRWVRESVRPTEVDSMHMATRIEHVRERLCQLYVLMTRARRGLFLVVGPELETESESMAGVLRAGLIGVGEDGCEDGVLARFGSREALEGEAPSNPTGLTEPGTRSIGFEVNEGSGGSGGRAKSPSATHESTGLSMSGFGGDGEEARLLGLAWHRLFEFVGFVEDGVPESSDLEAALATLLPEKDSAWHAQQVSAFLDGLAKPGIHQALSRASLGQVDSPEVHQELPFLRFTEEGAVQEGIIDRLVTYEVGDLKHALITDWKTDRVAAGAHAGHAERYRAQLALYRDAVSQLQGIPPEQIRAQIAFVRDGTIIDLFR